MKKTDENKLTRVALYIRVSTDRQAKEGDSLEAQEKALIDYAKEHNYIIIDTYIDGGESGQKIKRTNLQRLLKDVENNKIDLVIMTKLDRWFRNIADFYKVIEVLKRNKVDWKTIWEDYDTTTASGEFWLNMSLSMGQLEAKRTSERINEVFDYKYNVQKTACTGKAPYGYKISKEKKIIIDDEKSKNVIALFEHYASTNNLNKTASWFRTNIENKSTEIIKKYLKNPIYIGQFKRTKTQEIIEDYAPRIIDDELWFKVQKLIQINIKNNISDPTKKRHNTKPYIFSGLLICKECGHILSGKTNANSRHYYNCRYSYFKKCSNNKCINEEKLEKILLKKIIPTLSEKKSEIINIKSKEKKIVDNTNQLKTKLKKLTNLYLEDMIDIDYYREEYKLINSQIEKINEQKSQIKQIDYSYIDDFLKSNLLDVYDELDNLEKRKIWANLIDRVEIKDYNDIDIIV